MLWAIDVGNTHTVVGLYDTQWRATWRLATHSGDTEDQLAATLQGLCYLASLPFAADQLIVGSVVPSVNTVWRSFASEWLQTNAVFLNNGAQVGLSVTYDPPHAVGADRIANALAGVERYGAPLVVVDFGTATTFDTIDRQGQYVGGAILPGVLVSLQALATKAAKLPEVDLGAPDHAIGRNTVDALRSGVMFGYAGSVDAIARRIKQELGGDAKVIGTGGLAPLFRTLSQEMEAIEPNLTLDGLRLALERIAP